MLNSGQDNLAHKEAAPEIDDRTRRAMIAYIGIVSPKMVALAEQNPAVRQDAELLKLAKDKLAALAQSNLSKQVAIIIQAFPQLEKDESILDAKKRLIQMHIERMSEKMFLLLEENPELREDPELIEAATNRALALASTDLWKYLKNLIIAFPRVASSEVLLQLAASKVKVFGQRTNPKTGQESAAIATVLEPFPDDVKRQIREMAA